MYKSPVDVYRCHRELSISVSLGLLTARLKPIINVSNVYRDAKTITSHGHKSTEFNRATHVLTA